MIHTAILDHNTVDSNGALPNMSRVGQVYRHTGNGKLYKLTHYVWCGESDRWMLSMSPIKRIDEEHVAFPVIPIVRPLAHLDGKRATGEPRYVYVDTISRAQSPAWLEERR